MGRPSMASPGSSAAVERSWDVNVGFTGAGAAALTPVKTRGLQQGPAGLPKNTRVSAGRYRFYINTADVGTLAGVRAQVHTAAATAPLLGKYIAGSLAPVAGQTYSQFDVEFWDLATPTITDPPAGSFVDICVQFFDNAVSP